MSQPDIPDPQDLMASVRGALDAQQQAAETTVEGSAGGGVVKVTMTGAGEISAVSLSPEVVDADEIDMLQDLIVAACHDAAAKVAALQREALGALGQIDLGALGGLFGGSGGPGGPGQQG